MLRQLASLIPVFSRVWMGAKHRRRFILPLAVMMAAKTMGALLLHTRLTQTFGPFYGPSTRTWGREGPQQLWLYLFSAWDTGHYVSIASVGYHYPTYVFFPAYPILCRAVAMITGDFWLSAFIVSNLFGFASIPMLQLVSEYYMSRSDAVISTLAAMSFPYVFLFTTVSYTESLFLFSTLLCWYLYLKGKLVESSLAAALATLTKTYGVAIVIPMALGLLDRRRLRKLLPVTIPIAALLCWMLYLYLSTGDALAFLTQQGDWRTYLSRFGWIQYYIMPFLDFLYHAAPAIPEFGFLDVPLIVFSGYLLLNVFKVDDRLGIYSASLYLGLLMLGNSLSLPRFLSFIFPVWLTVGGRIKKPLVAVPALAFFLLTSLVLWSQFARSIWVS